MIALSRLKYAGLIFISLLAVVLLGARSAFAAGDPLRLIVTSNLEGRFSLMEENQEREDPLLLLAQSIFAERRSGRIDLHLDMGNAFYPGLLSKYSYGALMMDYLDFLSCDATLISSQDLRIGVDNLDFLQRDRKTRMLSSNIIRSKKALFTPYMVRQAGGEAVAVVGLSSQKILFDIAEKNLYDIQIADGKGVLKNALDDMERNGIRHVVLLSGMGFRETLALCAADSRIGLALCGGDNRGGLFGQSISSVELSDGRTVLALPEGNGYYLLELVVETGISIKSVARKPAKYSRTDSNAYREMLGRVSLWKKKLNEEENIVIADTWDKELRLNDEKILPLLRDRFNAELSAVHRNTVSGSTYRGEIKRLDLLGAVNQDYNVFIYSLTGAQIESILDRDEELLIGGIEKGRIQGYGLEKSRSYRFASPQPAFERMGQMLHTRLPYSNSWETMSDVMLADLKENKALLRDDYGYLDRRFRATIDFFISNFIDYSVVRRGREDSPPTGKPEASYRKWGLENRIDLSIYNRYHRITLTPYMNYVLLYTKEEDAYKFYYQQNLLRGTLLYLLNLYEVVKPYHKSQCDTVVRRVERQRSEEMQEARVKRQRPVEIRETAGLFLYSEIISGKIGAGFEKKVYEPEGKPYAGLEAILNIKYTFFRFLSYTLNVDSFFSGKEARGGAFYIRADIENKLSFNLNTMLAVSFKHRWYYLRSRELARAYVDSQLVTSLDVKTDFKLW